MKGAPANPINGTRSSLRSRRIVSSANGSSTSGSRARSRATPTRVADRVLHDRADAGFDPNRHADRRERHHDVREHDRRVERHPPERLEGELDGELGRPDGLEDVAIPAQLPVLGQVSAGLAHEPHRGAVDGFAPEGAQESVVHGSPRIRRRYGERPAAVPGDDGRYERLTLLGRRTIDDVTGSREGRWREDEGGPRGSLEWRRPTVVQGAARPAAFPRAVRLDRGRRPPARARRLRVPAVHLGIGERAGEGPDRRPLLHAVGRRDDVPQRRDAAAGSRAGTATSSRGSIGSSIEPGRSSPYLADPVESALGKVVPVSVLGGRRATRHASVHRRGGALATSRSSRGRPGTAPWFPTSCRDALGISPGETRSWSAPRTTGTVTFPVDGIYRSLYRGGASGYWRTWNDELVLYCANCAPPPASGDPAR